MPQITFRGSSLWYTNNTTHTGKGYTLTPGTVTQGFNEATPPLGTGTFIKLKGKEPADHVLHLEYITDAPQNLKTFVEAFNDGVTGTLATPLFTFANCILKSIGNWKYQATKDDRYFMAVDLTFREYPGGDQ